MIGLKLDKESEPMKVINKVFIFVLVIGLLAACNYPGSKSYVETEVAISFETMSAEQTAQAKIAEQTSEAEAQIQTQTAVVVGQTETALAAVTATSSPTATLDITETPTATDTPEFSGLPEGQKIVVAKGNAPFYKKKGENKVGLPVMEKLNPIQRYEAGFEFRVYKFVIKADGDAYFYQIAGPIGAGYFVSVGDVKDK